MNIVVCVKQVPDTSEVKIDPITNNLVREGVPGILNPYDRNSVELALQIKEKTGGRVTVLSMGPRQAADAVQECLDMGADEGVLLSDRAVGGSDTLATGYIMSKLIAGFDYDLVLCGNEAIDGCTGQVGPIIAGNLGLRQFTYVTDVSVKDRELLIHREVGTDIEIYEANLPAVLCVQKGINQPRNPKKTDKAVQIIDAEALGLDPLKIGNDGSPTRVVDIRMSDTKVKSYFTVDDSLSWEERIKFIINGGMTPRKVELWRGTPKELAKSIVGCEEFSKYLENTGCMEVLK